MRTHCCETAEPPLQRHCIITPLSVPFWQLVDLPGYGFAFAKEEKMERWAELMDLFLVVRFPFPFPLRL